MTLCTAALTLPLSDSGFSAEAEELRIALQDSRDRGEASRALFQEKSDAIASLWRLYNECSVDGWDGYDACAMTLAAARVAVDLIRVLPEGIPMPELTAENDGAISLDWSSSRRCCLSISTNGTERLAYAWLDGARSGSGVELFLDGRWPNRLLHEMESVNDKRHLATFGAHLHFSA
jgi:hypothetical protein